MSETPDSTASHARHRAAATAPVACAVLTVSDTRTVDDDESGALLRRGLEAAGHVVAQYSIVPDEPARIAPLLQEWTADAVVQAVLINGGTGIARRDRTFDVVERMLDKTLPGFGEIFRLLSFQEIGAAAMLSRAVAGVAGDTLLFSMPGSPHAVRLALEQLILPELRHLAWELRR